MPPHLTSFLVGFLSLATETIWVRTYAFANQSTPTAIAIVLGVYLIGIAVGAAIGGRICRTATDLRQVAATAILTASLIVAATPMLIVTLPPMKLVLILLILAPALLMSVCFPICHHLGTDLTRSGIGKSLSRVYAANILGSVIGPLFANFVVLNAVTTQLAFVLVGTAGMIVAAIMAIRANHEPALRHGSLASVALGIALVFQFSTPQVSQGHDNQLISRLSAVADPIRHVVESRQGIIVAYKDDAKGDIIFGGNVYDGRTNLDPRLNSNGLNRLAVLQAIAPNPRRVLIIGLSVGSWQHVIGGFPGVERMDVVEINPGYVELARNYDAQNKAVHDPRVNLIVGDGRKYLRQHPDQKYDLVLMNTTWHWRMYISLLLSEEFMSLIKQHMTPEAVLAFNTTESVDALKTAATVFPHAYRYDNFAIAGLTDWRPRLSGDAAIAALRSIAPNGQPMFKPQDGDVIESYLRPDRIKTLAEVETRAGRAGEVITDRNLITEYRYGRF